MSVYAIIQARMGSTRLPGKVLMKLGDKSVLEQVVQRVRKAHKVDGIIIATTINDEDDALEIEAKRLGVLCYRGSEMDVLSRYYEAAKLHQVDTVVRITSDCPLIDPEVIDLIVERYQSENCDIATNAGSDLSLRTFPRGLDTEVFSFTSLEEAQINATHPYMREHVTPYLYESGKKIVHILNETDYSSYRWTLDTPEDFEFCESVFTALAHESVDLTTSNIISYLEQHPEVVALNAHVEQKKIK